MDTASVILLLDFAVKAAPSIAALVDQVRAGGSITQADIDAATAARHAADAAWEAATAPPPEAAE